MTMTATARTSGRSGWMHTMLLVACVALLTGVIPQRSAAAESIDLQGATQTQQAVCEALGGATDVERQQLGGVDIATKTTCKGGLLDGMECTNSLVADSTNCSMSSGQPDDGTVWPPIDGEIPPFGEIGPTTPILESTVNVTLILAGLEAGLPAPEILSDLQAAAGGDQGAAPDTHSPDKHTSKGKARGQHGKKHGKGRKK